MKSLKTFTCITLLLALGSACKGTKTVTQSSSASPTLNQGTNVCLVGRWPNSALPLNLKMSSEFTTDYTNSDLVGGLNPLEQMAKAWNVPVQGSRVLITVPFAQTNSLGFATTTAFRDNEIGIYKSHNWFTNVSSSALAITQFYGTVTSSAGLGEYIQLTHADIIVNYRDYGSKMTMVDNPSFEFDVPTIILHEMGHLLGLCHQSSKPSVMAPYYLTEQRSLLTYDRDLIEDLYVAGSISNLSAMKNGKVKTNSAAELPPAGTEVSGIIELRADGECIHKVNGKEILRHKTKLK